MAHREGRPSLDEPASHWPDERSADGAITRSDHRTPGSVDMSDWATKLAAAARSHDSAAASGALSKAGSGAGAGAASGGQAGLEAGSGAGSEAGLEAVTGSSVEGEVADEESLWAGLDDVADGTEPSDEQLGMQPVGAAVYQAALDEQVLPSPCPALFRLHCTLCLFCALPGLHSVLVLCPARTALLLYCTLHVAHIVQPYRLRLSAAYPASLVSCLLLQSAVSVHMPTVDMFVCCHITTE